MNRRKKKKKPNTLFDIPKAELTLVILDNAQSLVTLTPALQNRRIAFRQNQAAGRLAAV